MKSNWLRFSIRELLMLVTIAALAMPYFYSVAFTARWIDLSSLAISSMVKKIDPSARIVSGSGGGGGFGTGGSEHEEFTILVPTQNADTFFPKLHEAIETKLSESGWIAFGRGTSRSNRELTRFDYCLTNGRTSCYVIGMILDRKKGTDELYGKDVEEIRFIIISTYAR